MKTFPVGDLSSILCKCNVANTVASNLLALHSITFTYNSYIMLIRQSDVKCESVITNVTLITLDIMYFLHCFYIFLSLFVPLIQIL